MTWQVWARDRQALFDWLPNITDESLQIVTETWRPCAVELYSQISVYIAREHVQERGKERARASKRARETGGGRWERERKRERANDLSLSLSLSMGSL